MDDPHSQDRVRGLWCATLTPLGDDGRVDAGRLVAHVRQLLARGVAGIAPFGTTGEGPSFSVAERQYGLDALLQGGIGAARLAAATGCAAFTDTIELTRHALACGVGRCLVLPPFFFKSLDDDAVFAYYAKLIESVADTRLRLYLYHIPQFSGVALTPAVVERLAREFPGTVMGVKDSGGDFANTKRLLARVPQLDILVGHEPDLPRLMCAGGAGSICGIANIHPELVRSLLAAQPDADAQRRIDALVDLFRRFPFMQALKSIKAMQTGDPAWGRLRTPLRPLSAARQAELAEALGRAGLVVELPGDA